MKTIFDKQVRDELQARINSLTENNQARWGKMKVAQMMKHCTLWDEWVLGIYKQEYRQEFLGKIFGKIALRSNTKDDKPLSKNMPAGKGFAVRDNGIDLEAQKEIWRSRIAEYEHFSNPDFIHDFFGTMTKEQIGIFAYKHSDHHLRQFGV